MPCNISVNSADDVRDIIGITIHPHSRPSEHFLRIQMFCVGWQIDLSLPMREDLQEEDLQRGSLVCR